MNNEEKYYTRRQMAKILSVHPMTIFREIQRGKIRAIKVGNDYRISESAFNEYTKSQEVNQEEGKDK
jgi:excisionase family DNA binding protein